MLNNLVILALAHDFTGKQTYLDGVIEGMDYILGRKPARAVVRDRVRREPAPEPAPSLLGPSGRRQVPSAPPGAVSGGPNSGLEDPCVQAAGLKGVRTAEVLRRQHRGLVGERDHHQLERAARVGGRLPGRERANERAHAAEGERPRAVLASVVLVACGPTADPGRRGRRAGQRRRPPAGRAAALLVSLEGKDADRWVPGGPYYEKAVMELRRQAVLGGGNYLLIDATTPPRDTDYLPAWIVKARLFSCPAGASAASAGEPDADARRARRACRDTGPEPPVPSAPIPSAPLVCEPDCSPGYTCLRGKCVSACNPLCQAGERCGADRICHPVTPPPSLERGTLENGFSSSKLSTSPLERFRCIWITYIPSDT